MNKVLIGLHEFDGPFSLDVEPLKQPGLLAVLWHRNNDLEIVQLRSATDLNALWKQLKPSYAGWPPHELSLAMYYMPNLSRGERSRVLADIFAEFEMVAA